MVQQLSILRFGVVNTNSQSNRRPSHLAARGSAEAAAGKGGCERHPWGAEAVAAEAVAEGAVGEETSLRIGCGNQ